MCTKCNYHKRRLQTVRHACMCSEREIRKSTKIQGSIIIVKQSLRYQCSAIEKWNFVSRLSRSVSSFLFFFSSHARCKHEYARVCNEGHFPSLSFIWRVLSQRIKSEESVVKPRTIAHKNKSSLPLDKKATREKQDNGKKARDSQKEKCIFRRACTYLIEKSWPVYVRLETLPRNIYFFFLYHFPPPT